MIYYTSLDNPPPLTLHTTNPSSTRAVEYQKIRYVRGGEDWRQEAEFSLGDYGKARPMLRSTSDLKTPTRTFTTTNQWICSWLDERSKIRISMVSTTTSNEIFSLFYISVNDMLGKEALFLLTSLSQPIVAKMDEPILHMRG